MDFYAFAQPHLDRVSRSFSFCIARLESPLQEWVAVSYLLCRLLDTVEDAQWSSTEAQENAFTVFHELAHNELGFNSSIHEKWAASFPRDIPEGERILLQDSARIFQQLHSLHPRVSRELKRTLFNMERGMRFFSTQKKSRGVLRLKNLKEVNQYCFFVAGIVGELLGDLLREARNETAPKLANTKAHHFGLFLQKINLLKDQQGDEKEGRFLVPEKSELLASLSRNAWEAFSYLEQIPAAEKGFRLFCAWSLFLGLASLPWISSGSHFGLLSKIPRSVTQSLMKTVEKVIDDGQALRELFAQSVKTLAPRKDRLSIQDNEIPSWFLLAYEGPLKASDFRELEI